MAKTKTFHLSPDEANAVYSAINYVQHSHRHQSMTWEAYKGALEPIRGYPIVDMQLDGLERAATDEGLRKLFLVTGKELKGDE